MEVESYMSKEWNCDFSQRGACPICHAMVCGDLPIALDWPPLGAASPQSRPQLPRSSDPIPAWQPQKGNNLTGPIPTTIGLISKLSNLSFSDNKLSGPIPKEIEGDLPNEIGNLTNLLALGLSSNSFSGHIPKEFSDLTSLWSLDINDNQLEGELPRSLASLINLQYLHVAMNRFTGIFPPDLGRNNTLYFVSLHDNFFTGEIPEAVCSGFNLTYIKVGNNSFSGPLQKCLRNCSNIRVADFSQNQFTGELLPDWTKYENLESLMVLSTFSPPSFWEALEKLIQEDREGSIQFRTV
ncbi:hypothetical protein QJS10_CPA06g00077 [Acorus calamus]|uniref:Uncharacterized protein n=1 Tax=Acorus calamus TaxID=4465 RepID=A0AAV9EN22_ACOCL|nr:hypothetical protein QJS10_CPA06g00077 [Acorus calamus]